MRKHENVALLDADGDQIGVIGSPIITSPISTQTILRAAVSAASSGNNTVVAAVSGEKIKVLSVILIVSGDVDVRLESDADGTALTGVMSLASDGNGFVLPPAPIGLHWVETVAGELLNLELSDAIQVSGCITYYTE